MLERVELYKKDKKEQDLKTICANSIVDTGLLISFNVKENVIVPN